MELSKTDTNAIILIPAVLMVLGLYFAHKQKSEFWGYAGYALLGLFVGGVLASTFATVKAN